MHDPVHRRLAAGHPEEAPGVLRDVDDLVLGVDDHRRRSEALDQAEVQLADRQLRFPARHQLAVPRGLPLHERLRRQHRPLALLQLQRPDERARPLRHRQADALRRVVGKDAVLLIEHAEQRAVVLHRLG
ncbi:MAG TPA: hypothetical protein PLW65_26210 [Pseudomonadota bacterium]|nr:hypothetical protein [Pseudomonadota bacterium]